MLLATRRMLFVTWMLLGSLLLGSVGLAQTAKPPSDADKATARKLMDIGDAKRKEGDLQAALEAYRGADDIMKVPSTSLDVGKAQIALGMLLEASTTLLRITRYKHPGGERLPDAFASAQAEAGELAATLPARIAEVTLEPSGLQGEARMKVDIDGQAIPFAALKLPR